MPRRGENIYKRKDGRWEGRYCKGHIEGKIQYGYVFARTYREVKSKLIKARESEREREKAEKTEPQDFPDMSAVSFEAAAKEWMDSLSPRLKESTIVKYLNVLRTYLLPKFGKCAVSEIKRKDVVDYSNVLLESGGANNRGLSPKTVTDILSVLKNILLFFAREKGCRIDDMKGISVKQQAKPLRILTRAEQQALNKYLCGNLTLSNLGILLCLYTGLRIGEICALRWEDILFDEKCVCVRRTMQRLQVQDGSNKKTKVVLSAPKSDCSARKIPIPDRIFELLVSAECPPDTYFLTGLRERYVEPRTMQNRFKTVARECGIDNLNFHSLRHTFATRCIELGFDMKSLSEILGHASINITMNRYVHPTMELKQENMDKLSELFAVK